MRVCDGSCSRLAALERYLRSARTEALVLKLRQEASVLAADGYASAAETMMMAAAVLDRPPRTRGVSGQDRG